MLFTSAVFGAFLTMASASSLPWAALPAPADSDARLEAALVWRDLRAYSNWWNHERHLLQEVEAGRALVDAAKSNAWPDVNILGEFDNLVSTVAPSGKPVQAALALFYFHGQLALQALVHVENGAAERLLDEAAGFWCAKREGNLFKFTGGNASAPLVGWLDTDNWLRIALHAEHLLPGSGQQLVSVSVALQDALAGSDVAVVVQGGGVLCEPLYDMFTDRSVHAMVENVRTMALAWRTDGSGSSNFQVVLDAPMLESVSPSLRQRQREDTVLQSLQEDAAGFVSLAVPPVLRRTIPSLVSDTLAAPPYNAPDAVLSAIGHLQGRLGWMAYEAPGDWAISAELDGPETALAVVPAVATWATYLATTFAPGATQDFTLESFPQSKSKVLHLRPDAALEGPYLAANGRRLLFVQQRSRLVRLLAEPDNQVPLAQDHRFPNTLMQGPLTAMMRSALEPARLGQSYLVLGSDGGWVNYLVWGAARLQTLLTRDATSGPLMRSLIATLPKVAALGSYLWLRTYDAAITLDVVDSLLTLQLTTSEI